MKSIHVGLYCTLAVLCFSCASGRSQQTSGTDASDGASLNQPPPRSTESLVRLKNDEPVWDERPIATQMEPVRIKAGTHVLAPDLAEQVVQILISGDTPVHDLKLEVQVGDGRFHDGEAHLQPIIKSMDFTKETIFEAGGCNSQDLGSLPQQAVWMVNVESNAVPANGVLATLTLDTTSLKSGTWPLHVRCTPADSTVEPVVVDG